LLNNYNSFLLWCKTNNLSLLQFKKTISNQNEYRDFIKKNYKTKSMLESVHNAHIFLNKVSKDINRKRDKNIPYLLSNLRMSICELG
jgi:hypothetical protein